MKTTKFSSLVLIKKEKLDEIERQIIDVQSRKRGLEKKIEKKKEEIRKFEFPDKGSMSQYQLSKEQFSLQMKTLEDLKASYDLRLKQLDGLKELYKEANIEHEKFLALEEEEIKKANKLKIYLESKEMDEVANILTQMKKRG
ncbi:MAG: hypothetical protein DSZ06_00150 [Sulfurospirillum sp.]|nr:MAG: hypothetical protein DSZ06_00150 [Sulfurospirillum sp.]